MTLGCNGRFTFSEAPAHLTMRIAPRAHRVTAGTATRRAPRQPATRTASGSRGRSTPSRPQRLRPRPPNSQVTPGQHRVRTSGLHCEAHLSSPAGRLVAGRRLLAVRAVRGHRLHPLRGQPGGGAGAPGVPGAGPGALATWRHNDQFGTQPSRSSDGGAPIITAATCAFRADQRKSLSVTRSRAGGARRSNQGGPPAPAPLRQREAGASQVQ